MLHAIHAALCDQESVLTLLITLYYTMKLLIQRLPVIYIYILIIENTQIILMLGLQFSLPFSNDTFYT